MIGRLSAAVLAATALSGCASVIVNPSWSAIPDAYAMGENYPLFASMADLEANVRVQCVARPEGDLAGCRVIKAVPEGLGFEDAALALTQDFRLNPRQVDGRPAKGDVAFTIRFRLPPDAGVPPWTGPEPSAESLIRARLAVNTLREAVPDTLPRPEELDVARDRQEKVHELVRENADAFRDRRYEASAMIFARTWTPEQLAYGVDWRGPAPPMPTEEQMLPATAESLALEHEARQALKAAYCARYACPAVEEIPLPPAPTGAAER